MINTTLIATVKAWMRKSLGASPLYCLNDVISTDRIIATARDSIRYLSVPPTGKINAIIMTKNTIPETMRRKSNNFERMNRIVNIETVKYMRRIKTDKTLTHNYPFF